MGLDESGFPQPTGEVERLGADSVVLALGQERTRARRGVPGIEVEDGVVRVGADLMTGHPGIFAGGDMVPAERTVTVAIGHGKRPPGTSTPGCAASVWEEPPERERGGLRAAEHVVLRRRAAHRAAKLESLAAQRPSTRWSTVSTRRTALLEARRCLSCGNCFACDNCFGVCPDNAVLKLGRRGDPYEIDLDFCKGCGICVAECPCGAIEMVPEEI